MRIGFDGKRAVQNFTGLGNYSRYIVDILCQFYPENEYVLYAPKKRENKRLDKLTKQYQQLQLSYPTTSSWKKLSSLWRVWGVTQQLEKEKKLQATLFSSFPLRLIIKSIIFAPNWFRIVYLLFGLKGNRVQIPDSPAAVSFKTDWAILLCH